MNKLIYFNGAMLRADEKLVTAGNRGLRYGDGLFETMKVTNGTIRLAERHVERLLHGMAVLQIPRPGYFTGDYLQETILELCRRNNMEESARVRLSVFRGNGTLYKVEEEQPCLLIETEVLAESYNRLNEKGLVVGIYEDIRKSNDILANLKSNNYLPYIMAALYVNQNRLDDALVLNSYGRICDATIANVFWIKGNTIATPPLSEGCVSGVMRGWLLESGVGSQEPGVGIIEKELTPDELLGADEVFLTNALYGIRWVGQLKDKYYTNSISSQLYSLLQSASR